jgi:hypothetical protein
MRIRTKPLLGFQSSKPTTSELAGTSNEGSKNPTLRSYGSSL